MQLRAGPQRKFSKMDVLIVEPIDPDVLQWLDAQHAVRCDPELAQDTPGFRRALFQARAVIIPPSVALDAKTLHCGPRLRMVGRLSAGADNIDLQACARAGVEVVRPTVASAVAEAEFVIGALLQMLRRVPIISAEGLLVGRELGGATVGVVGMAPAVKPLTQLLTAFGAQVLGYDPALHASDPAWAGTGVQPVGLRELVRSADGVAVLLGYFPRYEGLFGERLLAESKPNQVLVSLAHSSLFDEAALAHALRNGPLSAAWFDSLEPGWLDPSRPLHHCDTLQVTPHVAGTTQESRTRSAWAVALRVHHLLREQPLPAASSLADFTTTVPGALADLAGGPAPA
jgi:D-3-phosphoglycerate dehydrogenase / 2-oxoglutarate reductase